MPISYTRSFAHVDWVDNVDRVQAGGDAGFNGRFHGLESEFDTISGAVTQVNTQLTQQGGEIAALQQTVAALGGIVQAPVTLGLAPLMVPFNPDAGIAWSGMYWGTKLLGQPNGSYVRVPAGNPGGEADGVLPLTLPEGVTLMNLGVLGNAAQPALLLTSLVRELRVPPFTADELVVVNGFAVLPIQPNPVFTSNTHIFYLKCFIAGAAGSDKLRGFTLTYHP